MPICRTQNEKWLRRICLIPFFFSFFFVLFRLFLSIQYCGCVLSSRTHTHHNKNKRIGKKKEETSEHNNSRRRKIWKRRRRRKVTQWDYKKVRMKSWENGRWKKTLKQNKIIKKCWHFNFVLFVSIRVGRTRERARKEEQIMEKASWFNKYTQKDWQRSLCFNRKIIILHKKVVIISWKNNYGCLNVQLGTNG